MPYKSDRIAINNAKLDKRVKLTQEQKQEIFKLYASGDYSLRVLAEKFGVSKRTIHFIVKPEKLETVKKQFAERRKDGRYYDREKHNDYMKVHRKYKHDLYKDGKIEEGGNENGTY